MVLFYFLGVFILVSIGIFYFLIKDRVKDKKNLETDWQRFLKAESLNDIQGIASHGDTLIWNTSLLTEQLDILIAIVDARVTEYPELKKLEKDAYNKKLHYNRPLPGAGSSGGIKQSW